MNWSAVFVGASLSLTATSGAFAAEGADSHYLPGVAGDLGIALPPQPGLQTANILWYREGDAGAAVLQGQVNVDLDVVTLLDLAIATYTFEKPVLGGTYTIGAIVPFGYAELEATLTGPGGGSIRGSEDSFNLSDIALIPFQLNWSRGNFHFKLAETITAPTGEYDTDNVVNLGRNYWSFDTSGAVTWLNQETGTEISVAAGLMINTENPDTDYRTGNEFHVDFVANQFLSETFAVGVRGYWYDQITGDSGSGAALGDFESEAFGLGAGFVWTPAQAGGKLAIAAKFITDLHAENRFESDYGVLTVGWTF
jgi:hypothetical protein